MEQLLEFILWIADNLDTIDTSALYYDAEYAESIVMQFLDEQGL